MKVIRQYSLGLFLLVGDSFSNVLAIDFTTDSYRQVVEELTMLLKQGDIPKSQHFVIEKQDSFKKLLPKDESKGEVWFRSGIKGQPLKVLQVTHQYHDQHTGDIGRQLFSMSTFDVAMFNTVQRYSGDNTDPTHAKRSLFVAMAEALAAIDVGGSIVQLHGFDPKKRKTHSASVADIILSNATRYPSVTMFKKQICLRDYGSWLTRLYGTDVNELGGTQNVVGKALLSHDHVDFLHVEISSTVRQHLLDKPSETKGLLCLM